MGHSAKSINGRVTWTVDKGRLAETGPDFPKFTMTATNTFILLDLLKSEEAAIRKAAQAEGILDLRNEDKMDESELWYARGVEL